MGQSLRLWIKFSDSNRGDGSRDGGWLGEVPHRGRADLQERTEGQFEPTGRDLAVGQRRGRPLQVSQDQSRTKISSAR